MNLEGVDFVRDNDDVVAKFRQPPQEISYWFAANSRDIAERFRAMEERRVQEAFQMPKSLIDFRTQLNNRTWTFHRGKFRFWSTTSVSTSFGFNRKLRESQYAARCRGEVLPEPVYPLDIPDEEFSAGEMDMHHMADMDEMVQRKLERGCAITHDE